RRRAQRLVTLRTDAVQPISYRFFYTLRDDEIGKLTTFPASAFSSNGALLYQRLHHLFDEEGIALSLTEDRFGEVPGNVFVQQRGDLGVSFVCVEPLEQDASRKPFAV